MSKNTKVKIFCIYHQPGHIFESDIFVPIQTGASNSTCHLDILKDNTGDNISYKNENYAELTANYWVWKNYLKENQDVEYIGFCHYRRFIDFEKAPKAKNCFSEVKPTDQFVKIFEKKYNQKNIYPRIKNYDVILPKQFSTKGESLYEHYCKEHPSKDLHQLIKIIEEHYPDYVETMTDVLNDTKGYFCLNYVMKRNLFEEYMDWVFNILSKLEEISDWSEYKEYCAGKTPAYLIERFFNVWLRYKIKNNDIKILERHSILLKNLKLKKVFPGITYTEDENRRIISIFNTNIKLKKK